MSLDFLFDAFERGAADDDVGDAFGDSVDGLTDYLAEAKKQAINAVSQKAQAVKDAAAHTVNKQIEAAKQEAYDRLVRPIVAPAIGIAVGGTLALYLLLRRRPRD
jgi:uncharacterized protein YbjQ (UPF0145 family)